MSRPRPDDRNRERVRGGGRGGESGDDKAEPDPDVADRDRVISMSPGSRGGQAPANYHVSGQKSTPMGLLMYSTWQRVLSPSDGG